MGAVPHALQTPAPGMQDPGSALLSGRSPPSQERLVLLRGGMRQAWVCCRVRMELGEGEGLAGGWDRDVYGFSGPTNVRSRPARKLVTTKPDDRCHVPSRNSRDTCGVRVPRDVLWPRVGPHNSLLSHQADEKTGAPKG